MLKVLMIFGSPRQKGNSQKILEYILKGITSTQGDVEVQRIFLGTLDISPCIACDRCQRQLGCVLKDDMQPLYNLFNETDLVIVASPIYFNSISAQLKGMVDRCQAIWTSKYVHQKSIINRQKYRLGVFVATAGNPEKSAEFEPSIRVMDLFLKSINTHYYKNLFVDNIDKEPVVTRPEILNQGYQLGVDMIKKFIKESSKNV
ncbi:MAG: flavodoxin family protein [Halanaerobiales bacterium]|nr:flavodoxin family protein [Halanaerobiales bacterium]